jgi:undecaprenyl-diphosphatase
MIEPITWWHAIILGLTQGLTEFIPVSSSGHLNITHWLFGQSRELTFDVFLHLGTLFALVFYFRKDWVELLTNPEQKKLRNLIFLACVPAVIIGVALRDMQDGILADVRFNAFMMIVMGAVLLGADHVSRKERKVESTKTSDALIIGCAQALALIPGVSRSGATLTAGLLRGFERADAARFSFLMSMPITLGAVGFEVFNAIRKDEFATMHASPMVILLGIVVSAASGFWAINFMLQYLRTRGMMLFFVWRLVVGLAVFALYPFVGPPEHSEPATQPQTISAPVNQSEADFSSRSASRSSSAANGSNPLVR